MKKTPPYLIVTKSTGMQLESDYNGGPRPWLQEGDLDGVFHAFLVTKGHRLPVHGEGCSISVREMDGINRHGKTIVTKINVFSVELN